MNAGSISESSFIFNGMSEAIFWVSCAAVFYTFFGYAILIGALARICPRPVRRDAADCADFADEEKLPGVCAVVVAHNEENRIAARIENLLASDFPAEKLRVLVVSDGSDDATVARVEAFCSSPRIGILEHEPREGKAACLNEALEIADAEIVVFADARQRFAPETIRRLVENFADPEVGAVSGALEIERAASSIGQGVDAYWRVEKFIRAAESRVDSSIGCTGAVYAIRRELFQPIPHDTVLDDVVIPMQIALQKRRVIFDPRALAFDPQSLEPDAEQIRKQRTLAGNFQMLFRHPRWLLPWRNRLWWQLISHKYLRLLAPALLALAFFTNAALSVARPFYRAVFFAQILFYALAFAARFAPRVRLLSIPGGFVFLNWMTLRALRHYLAGSAELHQWRRKQ